MCPYCSGFHVCGSCHQYFSHAHSCVPIPIDPAASQNADGNSIIAAAELDREDEKPRRLRFLCEEESHFDHVHDDEIVLDDVLQHACGCETEHCSVPECERTKLELIHATTCCNPSKCVRSLSEVDCDQCSHFLSLFDLHVKRCSNAGCCVPHGLLLVRRVAE